MLLQAPLFNQAIPLLGMITGIVSMVVIGVVVVKLAQSQVGQAIARRLNKGPPAAAEIWSSARS